MSVWASLAYFWWQVFEPIVLEIGATVGGLSLMILFLLWIRQILNRGLS